MRLHRLLRQLLLLMCLLVSGCQGLVELHANLSEQEANDVIAELSSKNMQAKKRVDKNGISVLIEVVDMPRAVRILESAGLPRKQRTTMGDVFRKDGIISTPLEERARYLYALSQELESTLSQIDGVVVARVHVVLPERVAPGEPIQPASAAVFLKHTALLDPDIIRPRIQRLIQSSIMGLEDSNKLSIVFIPANAYKEEQQIVSFGPFLILRENKNFWVWSITLGCIFFVLLLLGLIVFLTPGLRQGIAGVIRSKPTSAAT